MELETEVEVQTGGDDDKTKKGQKVKPKPEPAKKPAAKRTLLERARDKAAEYKAAAGKYIDGKIRVVIDNVDAVKKWYDDISLKKMETVNPLFAQVLPRAKELFLAQVKDADVQIRQGGRTAPEQRKLFNQGRTTSGGIVTYADGYKSESNHQSPGTGLPGQAVDFNVYVNGEYIKNGEHPHYKRFYACVKQAADEAGITGFEWGGHWEGKKFDPSHVQYMGPMKAGPASVTDRKASPAFKKACVPCKKPQEAAGSRFMERVVPEGGVLDTYLKKNALPTQTLFKMQ